MIKAYAAMEIGGELEPFEYDPGELGPHDVEIDVAHCGICHSDLSMLKNDFGISAYPFVGGHEVSGKVAAVGDLVTNVKVGDNVGLGWHKGYCGTCNQCLGGDQNLCPKQQGTIVANHGGFVDKVRAQDTSVIKIPDALDIADAGPLLCGGITVFNPFVQFDVKPTDRVAVIGIGGLGHLALQFANAWGCEVTAFTSSQSKADEARAFGAHRIVNSRDADALKAERGRYDLVLSTVNVPLKWSAYINALAPRGRLHLVGAVMEPVPVSAGMMMNNQRAVSGTSVGAPATIATMLEFCARHDIVPQTEHMAMSKINDAIAHLEAGKARYRIVLENDF